MTAEEKNGFKEDKERFSKVQESDTKVAAFFNNIDQEVDDMSPRNIMTSEEAKSPLKIPLSESQYVPNTGINPKRSQCLICDFNL